MLDLAVQSDGEGVPVVLLHGLTATRRYVVMGSKWLERNGHRVVMYDARGHGESAPAPSPDDYGYEELAGDVGDVMDACGLESAVIAGASMGAHTAVRFALDSPARVRALVLITPGYEPGDDGSEERLRRWDALSEGLRSGGVEGFVAAYGRPPVPDAWQDTVQRVLRQRISLHRHPEAVADALRAVPRSAPFASWDELGRIRARTVVVASRDEADPEHPLAIGERYSDEIPGARLVTEEPGSSPLAWQGGRLSKVIAELAAQSVT